MPFALVFPVPSRISKEQPAGFEASAKEAFLLAWAGVTTPQHRTPTNTTQSKDPEQKERCCAVARGEELYQSLKIDRIELIAPRALCLGWVFRGKAPEEAREALALGEARALAQGRLSLRVQRRRRARLWARSWSLCWRRVGR